MRKRGWLCTSRERGATENVVAQWCDKCGCTVMSSVLAQWREVWLHSCEGRDFTGDTTPCRIIGVTLHAGLYPQRERGAAEGVVAQWCDKCGCVVVLSVAAQW